MLATARDNTNSVDLWMSCIQGFTNEQLLEKLEQLGITYPGLILSMDDEDDEEGYEDQDLQSSKSTYSNKVRDSMHPATTCIECFMLSHDYTSP